MALVASKKKQNILNIASCFSVQFLFISLFQYYSMVVDGNLFNLNDILNTQMMPLNVFLMGFNDKLGQRYIEDFLPALHTMGYHRYFND